jgi:hypothetical protein
MGVVKDLTTRGSANCDGYSTRSLSLRVGLAHFVVLDVAPNAGLTSALSVTSSVMCTSSSRKFAHVAWIALAPSDTEDAAMNERSGRRRDTRSAPRTEIKGVVAIARVTRVARPVLQRRMSL